MTAVQDLGRGAGGGSRQAGASGADAGSTGEGYVVIELDIDVSGIETADDLKLAIWRAYLGREPTAQELASKRVEYFDEDELRKAKARRPPRAKVDFQTDVRRLSREEEKRAAEAMKKLDPNDQSAIREAARREARGRGGGGSGGGGAAASKIEEALTLRYAAQVVQFNQLPRHLRDFLSSEHAPPMSMEELQGALMLAYALYNVSPESLEAMRSRAQGRARSWLELSLSVQKFLQEDAARTAEDQMRSSLRLKLSGLEPIFKQYVDWREAFGNFKEVLKESLGCSVFLSSYGAAMRAAGQITSDGTKEQDKLCYDRCADAFIADVGLLRASLLRELCTLANVLLDKLGHRLFEEEEKLGDLSYLAGLAGREERRIASQLLEEADLGKTADGQRIFSDLERKTRRSEAGWKVGSVYRDFSFFLVGGEAQEACSGTYRSLAEADSGEAARSVLKGEIEFRRDKIKDAREQLKKEPESALKQEKLMGRFRELQDIKPGSMSDQILEDAHLHLKIKGALWDAFEAAIGFALTLVASASGVGLVAVAAGLGSASLGVYGAYDAVDRFQVERAMFVTGLSGEDPSLVWVVVAILSAGKDVHDLGEALGALKSLSKALVQTGDVETYCSAVDGLVRTKALDAKTGRALQEGARHRVEAQAGARGLLGRASASSGGARGAASALEDERGLAALVSLALDAREGGVRNAESFLAHLGSLNALPGGKLSAEAKDLVQRAWTRAEQLRLTGSVNLRALPASVQKTLRASKVDVESVGRRARALGMSEEETRRFLTQWAEGGGDVSKLDDELRAFARRAADPPTPPGAPATPLPPKKAPAKVTLAELGQKKGVGEEARRGLAILDERSLQTMGKSSGEVVDEVGAILNAVSREHGAGVARQMFAELGKDGLLRLGRQAGRRNAGALFKAMGAKQTNLFAIQLQASTLKGLEREALAAEIVSLSKVRGVKPDHVRAFVGAFPEPGEMAGAVKRLGGAEGVAHFIGAPSVGNRAGALKGVYVSPVEEGAEGVRRAWDGLGDVDRFATKYRDKLVIVNTSGEEVGANLISVKARISAGVEDDVLVKSGFNLKGVDSADRQLVQATGYDLKKDRRFRKLSTKPSHLGDPRMSGKAGARTHQRAFDSEQKYLEDLAFRLDPKGDAAKVPRLDIHGVVTIVSQHPCCPACLTVMKEFKRQFPNIKLVVSYDTGSRLPWRALPSWW